MTTRKPARETTAVLDDLRRIVRVLRESSRSAEARLGVTGAQLFVLRALSEDAPLSLGELAERTRTHQSSVSVVVKRLVARRLVRRAVSPSDGRRIALTVTAQGSALLAQAPLAAQDELIDALEHLPRPVRTSLARGLRMVVRGMALHHAEPEMFFEETEAR